MLNKKVMICLALMVIAILFLNRLGLTETFAHPNPYYVHTNAHYQDRIPAPVRKNVRDFGWDIGFTRDSSIEGFVPFNSAEVANGQISTVKADQLYLEAAFKAIVEDDKGRIDTRNLSQFREQNHSNTQSRVLIDYVLSRINKRTGRKFHILDIQTTYKESAIDQSSGEIVDKYSTELFVQEKDSRKVSANATNIRIVFLVKGKTVMVQRLHFITDYFYKRPLIDGDNKYDRNFYLKNTFHLQQPFYTNEDKVLLSENDTDEILLFHHKDLRTPQYRCFSANPNEASDNINPNALGADRVKCELGGGMWDKPVEKDEECPFFMANKNYVNRHGGVDPSTGRCELPVGMKRIGYRFASNDPEHKPWCYNCNIGADGMPGSAGPCCDAQLDKSLYPNLNSPDYMYDGDTIERYQQARELGDRGLHWRRNPTRIRDVTNPLQKQPVFNAIIGPGLGPIDPESYPN